MILTKKFGKRPLTLAVAAAVVPVLATTAQAQTSRGASAILEEVVVTATKRAEILQDLPISVQALTGDSMRAQGAMTFDDYVNFMPNVTEAGNGPGNKEIYIRGSATEQSSVTVALAQGSAPGVALYLDETPVSLGSRNLDIYATDIERIETLSGPQGTLFGASSQAGTIRMITNKPVIGEAEHGAEALEVLGQHDVDLVLMDLHMPEMDGIEATKAIREGAVKGCDRDLPIVCLTADVFKETKEAIFSAGMNDFVTKPIEMHRLFQVLGQWQRNILARRTATS